MNIQRSEIPSVKFRDINNGQKFIVPGMCGKAVFHKTGDITAINLDSCQENPIAPFWDVKPIRITDILYENV